MLNRNSPHHTELIKHKFIVKVTILYKKKNMILCKKEAHFCRFDVHFFLIDISHEQ